MAEDLPLLRTRVPGPRSLALASELRRWESPNVTFVDPEGRFPVFWESARDCLVTDVDGNTFLDLTAAFGVAAVGHTNPRVAQAVAEQSGKLIHGMGDVHPAAIKVELARKIAEKTPGDLGFCLFGSDGADAVEAALKTARLYTGRSGVLAFHGGYHGLTYGALDVTSRSDFRTPFAGQLAGFGRHVPYTEPRQCPMHCDGECTRKCLGFVEEALQGKNIGALIVEPIQGRGGIIEPPPGWLSGLRQLCDAHGVLLIADEIFTGWGRTGDWFACDAEGVVPDILCVGKAMGGGFPISACVARPHIMAAWGESRGEALHTSTFLGSPLGCAAALAAIAELEERDLPGRARVVGGHFKGRLRALAERHPEAIVEVRGRGLMLGLRLASSSLVLRLVYDLLARGLIVLPAGPGDVLEFVPPLTVMEEQIDWAVDEMDAALAAN
uniref:Adenosylmethionine-8-amino-7-oxononanoate aminotransferase n=1 Tax=uncultured Armatimonadetes bacterium TaxID=157466 RepID=A0A6J4JQ11_9BACT|nr:Adenosylmethionine-8-amino-7-oxononanoate aminotransferase [uncultured Armatimonadetes bacterium]